MFTGIIEDIGTVSKIEREGSNLHITLSCSFTDELKIDQSVSHNGVCLTVVSKERDGYTVTAIDETLTKSNLDSLTTGTKVNLERAMKLGDRLDGHIVQGHVDQIGTCTAIKEVDGSWIFTFNYDHTTNNLTIEKGSITVNGVSLTVLDSKRDQFSVAIIPYTYLHTNFNNLKPSDKVNLEFDVIGKYVASLMKRGVD